MKRHLMLVFTVVLVSALNFSVSAQTKTREQILNDITAKRGQLAALEEQFLAVSDSDRIAFVELLKQPNTGMIRLLPREIFDSEVYKKQSKTITMRGGGAYYSFVKKTHEYGYGSDIELDHDYLSVGFAGYDYGMLLKLNLNEVPLENLTAEHVEAATLINYEVPVNEPEIRKEQMRFGQGVVMNGFVITRRVPVEIGASYLLRSIDYETSDVLVAIKVVRKDTDGSVIIAWKLLQNLPTPKAARNDVVR